MRSPRFPILSMSSLRMTSIYFLPYLNRDRERDQRDIARLLDGFRQPPLMRSAHTRDAARRDLSTLADEGAEQPRLLVINVVDTVDAEPAHLLAPEILLLADGLVAAGGAL